MKLVIKSGESVDNALAYLRDFLEGYKEEYPMLKGNMNIYVTLEGFGHRGCPDNEKEYVLTGGDPDDVEERNIGARKEEALAGWKNYVKAQYNKVKNFTTELDIAMRYIDTAEQKGRKPENVEKRKALVEKSKANLKEAEEMADVVGKLNDLLEAGNVKWYFVKHVSKSSPYNYKITPYIIFEDNAGAAWHFVGYENRYERPYGCLYSGLPNGYEEE